MRQTTRFLCVVFLLGPAVAGCGNRNGGAGRPASGTTAGRTAKPRPKPSGGSVRTEMQGVDFRVDPSVVMEIRWLHGELVPTREGQSPWFDDPSSFSVKIDQAEIALTPESMSAMMNNYVFKGPKAPVSDVKIEIAGNRLRQSATLNKAVKIHTTIEGELSVTPEGDIRLHPVSIKADGLPVKGLLNLFDVELSEMIKSQESRGLRIVENDFILDPERLLPPPRMAGKVTAIRLEGGRIVQTFGGGPRREPLKPSFPKADHYMFFRGRELSFGKLTMHGADLQIIDADPKDPFHFYLAGFKQQLVAGYSRTMPDGGLASFMPDFDQVGEGNLSPKESSAGSR